MAITEPYCEELNPHTYSEKYTHLHNANLRKLVLGVHCCYDAGTSYDVPVWILQDHTFTSITNY